MLGKYLEEGGGYQALSATTCATVVPLWGHLDENHVGDDGHNTDITCGDGDYYSKWSLKNVDDADENAFCCF